MLTRRRGSFCHQPEIWLCLWWWCFVGSEWHKRLSFFIHKLDFLSKRYEKVFKWIFVHFSPLFVARSKKLPILSKLWAVASECDFYVINQVFWGWREMLRRTLRFDLLLRFRLWHKCATVFGLTFCLWGSCARKVSCCVEAFVRNLKPGRAFWAIWHFIFENILERSLTNVPLFECSLFPQN